MFIGCCRYLWGFKVVERTKQEKKGIMPGFGLSQTIQQQASPNRQNKPKAGINTKDMP